MNTNGLVQHGTFGNRVNLGHQRLGTFTHPIDYLRNCVQAISKQRMDNSSRHPY